MSEERVYDDRQAAAILARAVELGRRASGAEIAERAGATLGELEKIAAEAGIAPELVREAASELASATGRGVASFWFGTPVSRTVAFSVGKRVDKETLERVLLELPRVAENGMGLCSPDGLTWASATAQSQNSGLQFSVEIRVEGERTEVEITDRRGGAIGGFFGGIVGGVGFGVGLPLAFAVGPELGMGAWGLLLGLGCLAIAWLGCRIGLGAYARKRDAKLERIRATIRRILERK